MVSVNVKIETVQYENVSSENKSKTVTGPQDFLNLKIIPTTKTAVTGGIPALFSYDFIIGTEGASSEGGILVDAGNAVVGNQVVLNGLPYTAGEEPGQFAIGANAAATATNLVSAINNDTRVGTIGFVVADNTGGTTNVIDLVSSLPGSEGDAVTLVPGDNLTTTAFSGGESPVTIRINKRRTTVIGNFGESIETDGFFTDLGTTNVQLHAVPHEDRNGDIEYDVFYTYTGAVGVNVGNLFTGTIEIPEGETLPEFPFSTFAIIPRAVTYVPRSQKGGQSFTRVYDYFFIISNP